MPSLKIYLNLDNLFDLRPDSIFPQHLLEESPEAVTGRDTRLMADGFEGVQITHDRTTVDPGSLLPHCGLGRVNHLSDVESLFARRAERGDECITLHVGWGMEDDGEMDSLVRAILDSSQKFQLPAYIETHRATITQDMWRTVQLTRRFPDVRFNLDLSHFYCGQEMVYGDWNQKLDFLQPVFDRTRFIHARIAAPGWIQAAIEDPRNKPNLAHGADYLAHFRQAWVRAMVGFLQAARTEQALIFAPELLTSNFYYARKFPDAEGNLREETDRYAQALIYRDIARECWEEALASRQA